MSGWDCSLLRGLLSRRHVEPGTALFAGNIFPPLFIHFFEIFNQLNLFIVVIMILKFLGSSWALIIMIISPSSLELPLLGVMMSQIIATLLPLLQWLPDQVAQIFNYMIVENRWITLLFLSSFTFKQFEFKFILVDQ